jgi:CHAT domain-containing protein
VLDEAADLARRTWTHTGISWLGLRIRCQARALQAGGQLVTPATIAELTAPALAHLARVPPGVERVKGARMRLLHSNWWLLRDLGFSAEALREERQAAQAAIDAAASGQDAVAEEDMTRWAADYYGKHSLLPLIQDHLGWVNERYGPGHKAALHLRRAVSFAHRSADRPADALAEMDEAARLARLHHPGDVDLQMWIAGERAPALTDSGLWLEARDEFILLRNWMLERTPTDHGNLMRMNYHLATVANALGDHEQAEAFADVAVRHAHQSALPNDRIEVEVAQLQRAEARLLRGVPGAADELRRVLDRNRPGDPSNAAPAFSLAKLAQQIGDRELLAWAQDLLQRHAQGALQPMQATRALVDLAAAWHTTPVDPARGRAMLERATVRSLSGRDLAVSVQTAFALARQLAPRQPDAAAWWFKRGANGLVALRQRGRAAQDEGAHRATFADHEADLRAFVALLIDEGRYLEARDALRVLREEELHDFTRRSRRRAAATRPGALAFNPREQRFEQALQPLVERLRAEQPLAEARARPLPLEELDKGWRADPQTDALLQDAQRELATVLAQAATPARPERAATKSPPQAEALPRGTARLQTFVREQGLDILLTTAGGWHRQHVPITRVELNRRVHAWRSALLNPASDAMTGAREFHALLIEPVQSHLRGVQQLQVSLDGALRYLPLAALHDGQRYLVQRYGLVMDDGIVAASPTQDLAERSAGALAERVAPTPTRAGLQLAAFGRTTPDADHAALPGVEAELKTLAAMGPADGNAPAGVHVLQDAAFTARALRDTLDAAPRVVHIASHFHLAAAEEESSYLLLGDGERLPLSRLAQLPWQRVRLVLLSACDSAVGDTPRHGREFNGLAGVLRQAGAANVLASLWPIADASTAAFMTEFYRPWSTSLPDAGWLAQAQRRWLQRHPDGPLAHPYHWAAFVWWGGSA